MKIYEYIVKMKDQASDKLGRLASSFGGASTKADRLSGATDKLGNKLSGITSPTARANNSFNQLNSQWTQSLSLGNLLTRVLGPVALGAALTFGASKASALARESEQVNVAFEVMMGSATKAHAMIAEITELANVTPFTRTELLDSAKLMLNFGIANEKILPNLKMIGDISGGNAVKMHLMTLAFSQSSAAGRLMGQDLLQMINAGFNPLQEISKKTGLSMAVLKDKMEKGAISTNMVEAAFKDATTEGGRFFGMMDKQSQTFEGRLSTLRDKAEIWATFVGQKLNEKLSPILDKSIELLDRLVDPGGAIKNQFDKNIKDYKDLVNVLEPMLDKFMVLEEKGFTGRTTEETQDFIKLQLQLKEKLPNGRVRDQNGKVLGFDSTKASKYLTGQIDLQVTNALKKISDLESEVNTVNSKILSERNQENRLDQIAELEKEKSRLMDFIDESKSIFSNRKIKEEYKSETKSGDPYADLLTDPAGKKSKLKGGIDSITGGGKQSVNVTINLQSLVAEQNFNTTTVKEALPDVERMVTEALLRVVNSANYAAAQ